MPLEIRTYQPADAPAVVALFRCSVLEIAPARYTPEQAGTWAGAERDPIAWHRRMNERITFVALQDDALAGWIEMERNGHLDFFHVAPDATRSSVAEKLYTRLLTEAHELRLAKLWAEASVFAESFFRKHGWSVDARETVIRDDIAIERARMSIALHA